MFRLSAWLVVASLLLSVLAATGCSRPEAATPGTDATDGRDAEIDEMANAYLLGDDTSTEGQQALKCRGARYDLSTSVRLGIGDYGAFEGADVEAVKAAILAENPGSASPLLTQWDACPAGGTFGVRFFPNKPLYDGTIIWSAELSCSIHSPEAYQRYRDGLQASQQ